MAKAEDNTEQLGAVRYRVSNAEAKPEKERKYLSEEEREFIKDLIDGYCDELTKKLKASHKIMDKLINSVCDATNTTQNRRIAQVQYNVLFKKYTHILRECPSPHNIRSNLNSLFNRSEEKLQQCRLTDETASALLKIAQEYELAFYGKDIAEAFAERPIKAKEEGNKEREFEVKSAEKAVKRDSFVEFEADYTIV